MFKYEFWWKFANRIRWWFGWQLQPRRCCKRGENLGPIVQDRPDLIYRRCKVCNSRHFELTASAGEFRTQGTQLG